MNKHLKRTKIVATIGPASSSEKVLKELFLNGVDVARLNFSHGSLAEKKGLIYKIRILSEKLKRQIAIIADLPGPKIRLGEVDGVFKIRKGDVITFGVTPEAQLPIQFDFSDSVSPGQKMYLNDGLIEFKILSTKKGVITAKALNNGWTTTKKGINLPETKFKEGIFTEDDKKGAEFAIKEGVEFIAFSFAQSAQDIAPVRDLIQKSGKNIKIITKVETPHAVADIENVIDASDCVMVARGDLASETSPAQVPLIQQKIIALARQKQKTVIVATEMLDSMINNPRPTRAEASDVAGAVMSQVDAVMLSAETAAGKYPVETVKTMNSIIENVEADPEFRRYIKINWENIKINDLKFNAIAASSASLAYRLKSPIIGAGTVTGKTANLLSSFRPSALIVAATHDPTVARQLALSWGVVPLVVPADIQSEFFGNTMADSIKKNRLAKKGNTIVLVWGSSVGTSGTTNTIRIIRY